MPRCSILTAVGNHINLTDDYVLQQHRKIQPDQFRDLRPFSGAYLMIIPESCVAPDFKLSPKMDRPTVALSAILTEWFKFIFIEETFGLWMKAVAFVLLNVSTF